MQYIKNKDCPKCKKEMIVVGGLAKFEVYLCVHCGHTEPVKKKGVKNESYNSK